MPLFGGSKRTVSASEYARWFHTMDSAADALGASLVPAAFATAIRDLVAQSDPRFGSIDLDRFTREVSALRAEIFGLAWGHAFMRSDEHLIAEGLVAKEVLTSQRLWELGQKYNHAVTSSVDAALPSGARFARGPRHSRTACGSASLRTGRSGACRTKLSDEL